MKKILWMLAGSLVTIALGIAAFLFFMSRATPSALEVWLARGARRAAMPSSARLRQNPVEKTPQVIHDGLAHWADHCASCHANDGSGETPMGKGLYPPAPDMRARETQEMTDGELFYVIENGVRLTGMPGWGQPGHPGVDSWKLVHFIRHLPELSFEEKREMEGLNPKSADQIEEERQQQEFLNGEDQNDQSQHSH